MLQSRQATLLSTKMYHQPNRFTQGTFVKKCMLMRAELICPGQRQSFANICLLGYAIAERNEV